MSIEVRGVEGGGEGAPGTRAEVALQPLQRPCWSRFILKDCSLSNSPHWSRGTMWGGGKVLWTDHNLSFCIPLCHSGCVWGKKVEELWVKELSLGKEADGWCSSFLGFLLFKSVSIANNLSSFSPSWICFPMTIIGKGSSCLYLGPQAFKSYFLLLFCQGEWENGWVGIWHLAKVNSPQFHSL